MQFAYGAGGEGVEPTRRLFVGGIPRYRKREEILRELGRQVEGLTDVILYPSAQDKAKNRGFAFAEFRCPAEAARARAKMSGQRGSLWGKTVAVDWAAPEPAVDSAVMATVRVLYVRNLMLSTTEEALRAHFDALQPGTVERVKKLKDFAFVHFTERRWALANLAALDGSLLDGAVLEVQLAKPSDRAAQARRSAALPPPQAAFCSANPITHAPPHPLNPTHHLAHHTQPPLFRLLLQPREPPFRGQPFHGHPQRMGPVGGPVDPGLAAQRQRLELYHQQSRVEAEKLRIMEEERALHRCWQTLDASALLRPPTGPPGPPQPQPLVQGQPQGLPQPLWRVGGAAEGRKAVGEGRRVSESLSHSREVARLAGGEDLRSPASPRLPHTPLFSRLYAVPNRKAPQLTASPVAQDAAEADDGPGLKRPIPLPHHSSFFQ